ncbi:hypothetical protein HK104_007511 [Borealophlyctis nickersoniae]|nr:hypothetical protein HK104_007511 [Borealophlyctis nickersoniae]
MPVLGISEVSGEPKRLCTGQDDVHNSKDDRTVAGNPPNFAKTTSETKMPGMPPFLDAMIYAPHIKYNQMKPEGERFDTTEF